MEPEFYAIEIKFFSGLDVRESCSRKLVRKQLPHRYLYEEPVCVNVREKAFGDLLVVGLPSFCLVSDYLLQELRGIGATGFDAIPADVRLIFPHEPVDAVFWQLVVTGWGGIASVESGIEKLDESTYGPEKYSPCTDPSKLLDENRYDGSDFFFIWPLPSTIWVSGRIVRLFRKLKVKHYDLSSMATHRFERLPDKPIGFGPYPLACYFPEERAEEVGAPLGIDWFEYQRSPY